MISENLLGDIFEECIPLFIALGDKSGGPFGDHEILHEEKT